MINNPLFRIFVGMIVIFAVSLIANFWQLILISIICTMGGGLIIWIPLSLAVGTAICRPISARRSPQGKVNTADSTAALKNYLIGAKQHGMTQQEAILRLTNAGWQLSQFENLMREVYL